MYTGSGWLLYAAVVPSINHQFCESLIDNVQPPSVPVI